MLANLTGTDHTNQPIDKQHQQEQPNWTTLANGTMPIYSALYLNESTSGGDGAYPNNGIMQVGGEESTGGASVKPIEGGGGNNSGGCNLMGQFNKTSTTTTPTSDTSNNLFSTYNHGHAIESLLDNNHNTSNQASTSSSVNHSHNQNPTPIQVQQSAAASKQHVLNIQDMLSGNGSGGGGAQSSSSLTSSPLSSSGPFGGCGSQVGGSIGTGGHLDSSPMSSLTSGSRSYSSILHSQNYENLIQARLSMFGDFQQQLHLQYQQLLGSSPSSTSTPSGAPDNSLFSPLSILGAASSSQPQRQPPSGYQLPHPNRFGVGQHQSLYSGSSRHSQYQVSDADGVPNGQQHTFGGVGIVGGVGGYSHVARNSGSAIGNMANNGGAGKFGGGRRNKLPFMAPNAGAGANTSTNSQVRQLNDHHHHHQPQQHHNNHHHQSTSTSNFLKSLYDNSLNMNSDGSERFSRKVFVGGLPPDIDEEEIKASFRRFGSLVVDWPHKAESKSYFPPKGYAFLLFHDEASVQALIDACLHEDDKLYLCVSSPTIKDKLVQIRPWRLSDADYVLDSTLALDPRRTVFVGGVPRPLKASELANIMNNLYGGVCYAGIDTDPELKYPKGAGRVAFSNHQSYIAAISARFVHLHHSEIEKRVEIKPYVLDDQFCDACRGARCANKFAPFFCANVTCLQYFCENCWSTVHSQQGKEFHKPLVKEGAERPRGMPLRWC